MQKLIAAFQQKKLVFLRYLCLNFNEMMTNDVNSFKQPGSGYLN